MKENNTEPKNEKNSKAKNEKKTKTTNKKTTETKNKKNVEATKKTSTQTKSQKSNTTSTKKSTGTAKKVVKETKTDIEPAKINKVETKIESKTDAKKIDNENKTKTKNKEKRNYSKIIALVITVIAIIVVLGAIAWTLNTVIKKQNFVAENPIATIEIENMGTITVELYPQYAPNTVANFIALANSGFYNGLTFHRTIPDFMIQGGDPNGDGSGNATLKDIGKDEDEEYAIKGEFIINGFNQNTLKHTRGVISMARSDYSSLGFTTQGYNSASCQFFIMTADNSSLDGTYAAFGKVQDGMDIVDQISNVEVETRESDDENLTADRPVNPPVITSISVDTKGVDYGVPETVEPFDYSSYIMSQYYNQ